MKRTTIAMAVWVMCASGMTLAAAAEPAPDAADRVVSPANRAVFEPCAGGAGAASVLAVRRDATALAAAGATFQRCRNDARSQAEIVAADLGIATTAFFAAHVHAGPAAVADYDRAAGYAHRAWSRAKLNGSANASSHIDPAPSLRTLPAGTNHMVTGVAEDGATSRQITTDPAGTFQPSSGTYVAQPGTRAAAPASAYELGVALEAAAARARNAILTAK